MNGSFEQSIDIYMADVSSMAFGGAWSGKKLDVLGEYLKAYTTALKNTPFRLAYIDAFAGAGIREVMPPSPGELFDDLLAEDDANYRHGSPLIALGTEPSLDNFIFIERDAASIAKLKAQVSSSYPLKADQVIYKHGDPQPMREARCGFLFQTVGWPQQEGGGQGTGRRPSRYVPEAEEAAAGETNRVEARLPKLDIA